MKGRDDFDAGRRVGKYELVTRLSVGGMAEMYLAVLPGPGGFKKFVALKMILPDVRRDEEFVAMFLDEAQLTAALSHPNLGQVYELGREGETGELYLAMEYIAGQSLRLVERRAKQRGRVLPVGFSCRVIRDACLGLHSAHTFVDAAGRARAVVHRDVSPSNVMVSYQGHVKVIDFGIARAKGRRVRTQVGQVRGTVGYMSPEQATDEPLDARSDVFSAGMVLYELLAGEPPFAGLDDTQLLTTLAVAHVPSLAEVAPRVPAAVCEVVMSALARDRTKRCPSARELARRLEHACPDLMDDEGVAEVMRELFPDTIELSRQLLESAGAAEAPGPRLCETAVALQAATNPAHDVPQEPPAGPARARWLAVAAGLAVVAVAAGGLWWSSAEAEAEPEDDPAMAAREAEVMPQLHVALAAHDATRARQLVDACTVRGKKCPSAQALLLQVEAEEQRRAEAQARTAAEREAAPPSAPPAAAPCDLDGARASLKALDADGATAKLRACTTPTGLDPRAEKLLQELRRDAWVKPWVDRAKKAMDEGRLADARAELSAVPKDSVWREARQALEQRARELALDKGYVGPGGKVLTVPAVKSPAAQPAPRAEDPGRRWVTQADQRLKQGDTAGAVKLLRECTSAAPTSAECELSLGKALAKDGQPAAAYRAYKRFLDLAKPGDARVPKVQSLVRDYEGR